MKHQYHWLGKITFVLFLVGFLFSCRAKVDRSTEQSQAIAQEQQKEPTISYGDLIIKEQSDYVMIPVNVQESNREKASILDSSRSYKENYSPLYNLIFYRKQDGETHLLLDKKAIINTYEWIETKSAGKPPTRVWLYRIIDQDTNKDKKLDSQDAVIGYISDVSGKNLQQVTPQNTKVLNWVVLPSQNAVFIRIIKDSNGDNKFTSADKTNFVRVSLEQPKMGTEIISESIEQKIKSYLK
ncbi:hypothetical protein CLI64_02860 [Nostoc sp. CENA543]|uniref:hypothetical protein n=1 Tax=Nostoc sp. CENA543 TaxID=1869241 RepID=UPI000CA38595|nr:hypothetical protein [Nostoc sp. CENA543]AUS99419.1 hypothetical protein CLI64_02860 [Nostoc sp. CENA543]